MEALLLSISAYKEEIPLKKLSFTDFVADKYKPRKFDPVWLKGNIFFSKPHSDTKCDKLHVTMI